MEYFVHYVNSVIICLSSKELYSSLYCQIDRHMMYSIASWLHSNFESQMLDKFLNYALINLNYTLNGILYPVFKIMLTIYWNDIALIKSFWVCVFLFSSKI